MTQTTNDEIKALCVKADALATALSERYDMCYSEDLKKHDHEFAKDVIRHIAQKFCERMKNVQY